MGKSVMLKSVWKVSGAEITVWMTANSQVLNEASNVRTPQHEGTVNELESISRMQPRHAEQCIHLSASLFPGRHGRSSLASWIRWLTGCSQILANSRRFYWFWLPGYPNICKTHLGNLYKNDSTCNHQKEEDFCGVHVPTLGFQSLYLVKCTVPSGVIPC